MNDGSKYGLVSRIYVVRGQNVMLDKDLAELYGVKPIRLREQVKRNINRSPVKFMFRLTEEEASTMVSQNAIASKSLLGGTNPLVFTEYGVLMLANVIKSDQAIRMSIRIIEVFVALRESLHLQKGLLTKLEKLEAKTLKHDDDLKLIFSYLKKLFNPPMPPPRRIGFRRKDEPS